MLTWQSQPKQHLTDATIQELIGHTTTEPTLYLHARRELFAQIHTVRIMTAAMEPGGPGAGPELVKLEERTEDLGRTLTASYESMSDELTKLESD